MKLTIVATTHFVIEDDSEYLLDVVAEFRCNGSSTELWEMVPANDRGEVHAVELYVGDPWDGEEITRRPRVSP